MTNPALAAALAAARAAARDAAYAAYDAARDAPDAADAAYDAALDALDAALDDAEAEDEGVGLARGDITAGQTAGAYAVGVESDLDVAGVAIDERAGQIRPVPLHREAADRIKVLAEEDVPLLGGAASHAKRVPDRLLQRDLVLPRGQRALEARQHKEILREGDQRLHLPGQAAEHSHEGPGQALP